MQSVVYPPVVDRLVARVPNATALKASMGAARRDVPAEFPLRRSHGSGHDLETPYLFGALNPTVGEADRVISATLQRYLTTLAKTRDPNDDALPRWPTFDPEARSFLAFTERRPSPVKACAGPIGIYTSSVPRLPARSRRRDTDVRPVGVPDPTTQR